MLCVCRLQNPQDLESSRDTRWCLRAQPAQHQQNVLCCFEASCCIDVARSSDSFISLQPRNHARCYYAKRLHCLTARQLTTLLLEFVAEVKASRRLQVELNEIPTKRKQTKETIQLLRSVATSQFQPSLERRNGLGASPNRKSACTRASASRQHHEEIKPTSKAERQEQPHTQELFVPANRWSRRRPSRLC